MSHTDIRRNPHAPYARLKDRSVQGRFLEYAKPDHRNHRRDRRHRQLRRADCPRDFSKRLTAFCGLLDLRPQSSIGRQPTQPRRPRLYPKTRRRR